METTIEGSGENLLKLGPFFEVALALALHKRVTSCLFKHPLQLGNTNRNKKHTIDSTPIGTVQGRFIFHWKSFSIQFKTLETGESTIGF